MALTAATAPKKKKESILNGHLKTILAGVGGCLLATAIIATVSHFTSHDIHQDRVDKKNQTQVWFSQWWDEKFARDIQPEFDEIKKMIRAKAD